MADEAKVALNKAVQLHNKAAIEEAIAIAEKSGCGESPECTAAHAMLKQIARETTKPKYIFYPQWMIPSNVLLMISCKFDT